jgi:hypothetical protein
MKCILEKLAANEHKKIGDARYAESFINCPLFGGRQICYWCCLHIHDIAEPLHRGDYSLAHPEYEAVVAKETGRDWNDVWSVCSKCSR